MMFFKNHFKKVVWLALSLLFTLCLSLGAACGLTTPKREEKIELLSEADQPTAVVSQQFDVMSIVTFTNGYDVFLSECYYLDDGMNRVNIVVVEETKFTPTVEKDVFITLQIKGGTLIKEAVIKVVAPVSELQDHFMSSWNDQGVGKIVTANQAYQYNGSQSVINVFYSGAAGSAISGPGIGGFYYDGDDVLPFSVTDWKNAVLVMDIYNPGTENLNIYHCFVKDKATWTSDVTGQYGQAKLATLTAGEWTNIAFSFNMFGIDYNFFEKYNGNMYLGFRVGHETVPATTPYEWSMYIANMDIVDYSAERFPDLETVRPDQKWDAMEGDTIDKEALKHLYAETTDFRYANIVTTGEIVSYATEGVDKPNESSGEWFNKYTITANPADTDANGPQIYSTPLLYKNEGYFKLNAEQAAIDYSIAAVSFDIYNPNDVDLPIVLNTTLVGYLVYMQQVGVAKANQWTTISCAINTLGIDPEGTYQFAFTLGGVRHKFETLNYYIDNVKIYEDESLFVEPVEDVKLSEVEAALANGNYEFNAENNPAGNNGVAFLAVDKKDEQLEAGKKFLQVTVSFTEFGSAPAFCYTAGIATYKYSWGYSHEGVQVFSYNDYRTGAILGSCNAQNQAIARDTGVKVYENGTCVINHNSSAAWSYYSSVGTYNVANGKLSTGADYIFEYDLTKCTGDLIINFGATATIKAINWVEASGDGIQSGEEVVVNDAGDVDALAHLFAGGSLKWTGSTTVGEAVAYSAVEDIAKPEGVEGNTLIKYTHTTTNYDATSGYQINSIPLRYSSGTYAFNEEQAKLDFSKAYISFYIYNPNSVDLALTFGTNIGAYPALANIGGATAKAGEWTKIEIPLESINVSGSYELYVFVGGVRLQVEELVYYIDDVQVYEEESLPVEPGDGIQGGEEVVVNDAGDVDALAHLFAGGSLKWTGSTTVGEAVAYSAVEGIAKPEGVEGNTLIKYTHTTTNYDATSGYQINSIPLRYSSGTYAFNEEQAKLDFSKAYISFYIYNPNSVDLALTFGTNIGAYPAAANIGGATAKAGEWTKIEIPLESIRIETTNTMKNEDYTAVCTPMIPLLEMMNYLRDRDPVRSKRYEDAAGWICEYLYRRGFDLNTEGGRTEKAEKPITDGGLCCTALTLLYYCKHVKTVKRYLRFVKEILKTHESWVMNSPIAQIRGSSLRLAGTLWDGDKDGPALDCGYAWTIWRAECNWLYYELTGDEKYRDKAINAFNTNFAKINEKGDSFAIYIVDDITGGGFHSVSDEVRFEIAPKFPRQTDSGLSRYVWMRVVDCLLQSDK